MDSKQNPQQQSQTTDSLVHRMAGPSSGKAGLGKDQTEINRIIVEASKGSKFYENEKKKDAELTLRIDRILKQRANAVKGADLKKIEASVDQILIHLESQRDLSQIIVHVDMDAFYANVELLDNPKLKGKPFAVGKGVLTTASYEARKYGVRSGMAGFIAKKLCPELIFVPNRFFRYTELSEQVMAIFRRYDPEMCPGGCDEGYLNITQYSERYSLSAEDCVRRIREEVFRETNLTVSAGIAPNKMLAKICSDKNKPNGQFQLDFDAESIKAFMHDLPIRKVPGIGRVNERLLDAVGIKTCGDVYKQRAIISLMDKHFGLVFLLRTYLGIASNVVQPYAREERKSIGAERTFAPLDNKVQILEKLSDISNELEKDMDESGWTGRTVTLKYKLDTYQVFTRAKSLDYWVSMKEDLFSIGKELLFPELPLRLRLIGLRVTKLKDLRSSEPTNGIKRFFESTTDSNPRKKTKVEDIVDVDEHEESMPGYHELDETDCNAHAHDDELEIDVEVPELNSLHATPTRPPHSTSHVELSSNNKQAAGLSRPRSNSEAFNTKSKQHRGEVPVITQTCPICAKVLETDNAGLNAHIDFCLSRGTIMQAQKESSKISSQSHSKGGPITKKSVSKPRSCSKRMGG